MGRLARVIAVGRPHHVTQCGNYGKNVFKTDGDRQAYLDGLVEYGRMYGLKILAYCLMNNHVHLVVVPKKADSLGRCLARVHMRYSQRINRRRGRPGHLWQGRFFSCILDQAHLWAAVRYVEQNPLRAGMVKRAEEYPWSSAAGHCGLREDPLLSGNLESTGRVGDWSAWLGEAEDREVVRRIKAKTQTGRPCGGERFVARLEELLGRTLAPKPRGRPPKTPKPKAKIKTAKKHTKKTKKKAKK